MVLRYGRTRLVNPSSTTDQIPHNCRTTTIVLTRYLSHVYYKTRQVINSPINSIAWGKKLARFCPMWSDMGICIYLMDPCSSKVFGKSDVTFKINWKKINEQTDLQKPYVDGTTPCRKPKNRRHKKLFKMQCNI